MSFCATSAWPTENQLHQVYYLGYVGPVHNQRHATRVITDLRLHRRIALVRTAQRTPGQLEFAFDREAQCA
jgi:hypothetical protein